MNITFNLGVAIFFVILFSSGESKSLQRKIRSLQTSSINIQVYMQKLNYFNMYYLKRFNKKHKGLKGSTTNHDDQ